MLEQELSEMDRITQLQDGIDQLLTIMANSVNYLVSSANFKQVNPDIPITKTREKAATAEEFEANKRELVDDLIKKAKQIEILIKSLPIFDPEEEQARTIARLSALEQEMGVANQEYREAVDRAKMLHKEVSDILEVMLSTHKSSR
ncbi:hypothetical protein BS47DRAFT_1295675 [Hydnum rufescens UP504]|uniref:Mediator of RNA polymerase II transcription subunit 21 n=1 Tax=Hydnum rufescens UP504 TaxID=1448309 RepID=A0A9P6AXM9_9AGAM|nr:hypothetical protein BS47DRAFT_1295675 [Hydnum rufescens UP504]